MATLGLEPRQPRALAFAPGGVRTDFRLLEVDAQLLQEITDKGVVVKGGEEDEAVLVTSCRTYAMKLVETSNLQLLVRPTPQEGGESGDEHQGQAAGGAWRTATPPALAGPMGMAQGLMTQWDHFRSADTRAPVLVCATSASHIELVEVPPRLGALRGLLWRRPYGMEDERGEPEGDGGDTEMVKADGGGGGGSGGGGGGGGGGGSSRAAGYTFAELLEAVQASPGELRAALAAEGALELHGRWRAVEGGYLGALLELVLLTAEQEGMAPRAIREQPLVSSLQADGYHPAVVQHCLGVYGTLAEAASGGGGDAVGAVWALEEAKVCVHFARKVLGGKGMPLSEFSAAWARAVPYGMVTSLEMLRSEALVDGAGSEARISPFPAASLPADPAERFAALFGRRARWEWTDLEPYLAGVKVPGQSAEALLMRFARASQHTPAAPLVYSAR